MAIWAAWHPKKGFGVVEDISLRATENDAAADAGKYNWCEQANNWRAVEVRLMKIKRQTSVVEVRPLAEMFE